MFRISILTILLCGAVSSSSATAVAQTTCGDPSGRTTELAPGLVYRLHTDGAAGTPSSGAYIFAFKSQETGGRLDVVLHGTGQGGGALDPPGSGQDDTAAYVGSPPAGGVGAAVDRLTAIFGHPDCFDWPGGVDVRVYVQHGHVDHANQELLDELGSRAGIRVIAAFYHRGDRAILLCQDADGDPLVRNGETADIGAAYCGFSGEPAAFRGHPFARPLDLTMWIELGTLTDPFCQPLPPPFNGFPLHDGTPVEVRRDNDVHTPGVLDLLVQGSWQIASLGTARSVACSYPGYTTYQPHPD